MTKTDHRLGRGNARAEEVSPPRYARVVQRHPLVTFFALSYLGAWTVWTPVVVSGDDLPGPMRPLLLMLGSLVPSTMGVVLVAALHGRHGVRALLHRLVMGRIGLPSYVLVLVLPLLAPLALWLSMLSGGSAPSMDTPLVGVLAIFLLSIFPGSALGEEIGWRGFALPVLQARHSALRASLVIGVIWGCWHLPIWLASDEYPLSLFAAFVVSVIAMSVLCTWMYNSTGGSLLIVVLFHATANLPISLLITPLGEEMAQPFLIFTALMVVMAGSVVAATGAEHLSLTRTRQTSST